ncbi:Arv1-like family-domain-containing protein [Vararia minispora EC-137]|uniref:Arv1-like family-domain-containing protein n=1 Tax=Vararia minispora EC-137 TaxID=1314806 RepID=A0ACB8QKA8_9AGAM|nr:Arv1-like family-domain-containing protein [Vararia minispora EC-137]
MPVCVHCTHIVPYLYTVYQSAHNVRLEQCPSCRLFVDPYVEHDNLIVLLDLILFKRSVYRHLLFNRGSPPRRATGRSGSQQDDRGPTMEHRINSAGWLLTLRVGLAVVLVDAFIRWTELRARLLPKPDVWTGRDSKMFYRILFGCLMETVAFHVGITVASFTALMIVDSVTTWRMHPTVPPRSNVRKLLQYVLCMHGSYANGLTARLSYSHIPLCLLYSSVTKFFLLFLLAVWGLDLPKPDPFPTSKALSYKYTINFEHPIFTVIWEALDDDKLDRRWVVRNVLGGMAAGFGLRVVLDCHPILTTAIILTGWVVKAGVADIVGGFVGKDIAEAWLAYSIP